MWSRILQFPSFSPSFLLSIYIPSPSMSISPTPSLYCFSLSLRPYLFVLLSLSLFPRPSLYIHLSMFISPPFPSRSSLSLRPSFSVPPSPSVTFIHLNTFFFDVSVQSWNSHDRNSPSTVHVSENCEQVEWSQLYKGSTSSTLCLLTWSL